jgi:hypothetical protein
MFDEYPKAVETSGVKEAWKTAPVTFETCWMVPYWYKQGWDIDFIIEQGYKYHVSVFMPKSNAFPRAWMGKLMEFNKRIGYRFHIHQVLLPLEARPGAAVPLEAVIDNRGIAPIYRPYKMALRFSQGKRQHVVALPQDIRQWLVDLNFFRQEIVLPRGLKRGVAEISTAIVNDDHQPVVKFASKGLGKDGWTKLTHMDVL